MMKRGSMGNIRIPVEFPGAVITTGREGHYLIRKPCEAFGLACENDISFTVISVVKRAYAYRIPGCDEFVLFAVVDNAGELGIEHGEHFRSVFPVKRKQNFAVAAAFKAITFSDKILFYFFETVDLTVAYGEAFIHTEGLHAFRVQPHDGQPVKA